MKPLPDILTYNLGERPLLQNTAREEIYRKAYDNLNDATLTALHIMDLAKNVQLP